MSGSGQHVRTSRPGITLLAVELRDTGTVLLAEDGYARSLTAVSARIGDGTTALLAPLLDLLLWSVLWRSEDRLRTLRPLDIQTSAISGAVRRDDLRDPDGGA